jgi:hypothetical protein
MENTYVTAIMRGQIMKGEEENVEKIKMLLCKI